MQANEVKLRELIEGTKQFVVPLFQREYSWNDRQWKQLWDDIAELYESDKPRPHFFGSVVTMQAASSPEGVAKYILIDGQQRLTTVFILLAVLRDRARRSDRNALAEEIDKTLLVNQFREGADRFKLQPTSVNSNLEHYRKIIGGNKCPQDSRLVIAYSYFERKIEYHGFDEVKMKDIIAANFVLVSIVLSQGDDPYRVFESLNAKGQPLTQADLIRNFVLMRINVDDQEEMHERLWNPMERRLGESLTEFIRHYLMKDGDEVRKTDVYYSLRDHIGSRDTDEYLEEMNRFSEYYQKLLDPDYESNPKIGEALARINRLEVTTAYPFLLKCYGDVAIGKLSENDFAEITRIIENFMIRRFACSVPTYGLNRMYVALYSQIKEREAEHGFIGALKRLLQTKSYPRDVDFKANLASTKLYGVGERLNKTRLILESLEAAYKHKEHVNLENLTIEHIMPQQLTEEWKKDLGSDWGLTHETLLHTLGNLTLTAYNSEMSNDGYVIKQRRLVESHLDMNKYFVDMTKWTKQEIERRSEHLSAIAIEIWPYFGEISGPSGGKSGVTGTTPRVLSIIGQDFKVHSWREVLEQTLNVIWELEPERFQNLTDKYPHYVSKTNDGLRESRQLKCGMYAEVHLSSRQVDYFCKQAIEAVGLSPDDWQVEVE